MIVKHFRIGDVDHYKLRPANTEPAVEYDARSLPQFLFFAAGFMTILVLLVLRHRVRDLSDRAVTLLRSVFGQKYSLDGLACVPGAGPVVLLLEFNDSAALQAVRSAVDRFVAVYEPKTADTPDLESARTVLKRDDVVGVLMASPAAAVLVHALGACTFGFTSTAIDWYSAKWRAA